MTILHVLESTTVSDYMLKKILATGSNSKNFEVLRPLENEPPYFLGLWCTKIEKRPYHHHKHETPQNKNYASSVMAIHGPLTRQMVVSSGFDR